MKHDFINAVKIHISQENDLLEIRKVLIHFQEKGMPKNFMLAGLNEIRKSEHEDIVLELMDFAEGFCDPRLAIYSK
ncbi:MAG: hypothetical protein ABN482_06810 [Corticimicrobacter sp.]|uniref:hypothetical protein n=1 Tax=Corticimicrobacter sp. TaxID=2678536 RepID=UPI0032DB4F6C